MADRKPPTEIVKHLAATLGEANDLLREFAAETGIEPVRDQNVGSLVEQCIAICEERQAERREPVRIVHHMACTGGTLLSKCIAAMPNTQLLSEVNPLSPSGEGLEKPVFAPTDMIRQVKQSTRGADTALLAEMFLDNLDRIQEAAQGNGYRLVLRDHSHSQYCFGPAVSTRPKLAEVVARRHQVLSIVTVRNPVESFLSLKARKWHLQFEPSTFDEYCMRYLAFLGDHHGVPVFRYEDFVREPHRVMAEMCGKLELPFSDQFDVLFGVFRLTGDSGRSSDRIRQQPPRKLDPETAAEVEASTHYPRLRAMLGYD